MAKFLIFGFQYNTLLIMDIELFRAYCLSKKGVSESFPFDDTTLVFKVMGKMFALLNTQYPHSANLKCLPDNCLKIREKYPDVMPGYHMNKKHWLTVPFDALMDDKTILNWVDESYRLIVSSLTKKLQKELEALHND